MTAFAIDQYYARLADSEARGPQLYGGNVAIVQLRCFKFYHPDVGSWMTDPTGRQRWLGPKTSRVYAILHRLSTSGERTTMRQIAGEALCTPGTVSRAVTRLQAFGFFAIDVVRGRNGGLTVRRRRVGDAFAHYARAAWTRIRSWINVASRSPESVEIVSTTRKEKDATFRRWLDGVRVLAGEITIDEARSAAGLDRVPHRAPDHGERVGPDPAGFAAAVIAERRRLAIIDPEGEREAIHPLWG